MKNKKSIINIVLVEPEIPPNTGNIGRLCVGLNISLFLVGKLGFSLKNKYLKRAGLDYWDHLKYYRYKSLNELRKEFSNSRFFYFSKKAFNVYYSANFKKGDFLIFGKETEGLPEKLLEKNKDFTYRIPMRGETRSLNLSNSVAIVAYEAFRQINWERK
ncbi:MAG: tRNA (cytidine(34)-2'-O)-methyltransferase [Candidatus Mcinerneyibacterium aminivorans]|jgi:tRNA (cytidine/uridine-2'-O-)-methyltransferase|uniref:Putative tRNA (cytidine(34)-2'-O)-methyltransferase n=1 Tax=Candidatus Mcinerneyibacterium aminivorans TaxID=2703815 RepID=A0A5D0MHU2_9BACT|nr:MAG: tRNA (cytidine(34)-2'-O)-methyltransferase [Candidatus Mcinerneyibacterium aminivorans]